MSVSILEILKQNKFIIDEPVLWSILSCGATFIQKKISSRDNELCLMSLESMCISMEGQLTVRREANGRFSRTYVMPEIVDVVLNWQGGDVLLKTEILLYSLGISLSLCNKDRKDQTSAISDTLRSLIDQVTDRIASKRMTLLEVLRICSTKAKEFTRGKTFNYHLCMFYKSYKAPNDIPRMMRSMSQSNVHARVPNIGNIRQMSFDSFPIAGSPSDPHSESMNHSFNQDSSTENINSNHSQSGSISSLSPSFSENSNKGQIATSNYANLMINAIDPHQNITEALEKVKARRKIIRNNGPVKSPTIVNFSESPNNSSRASKDDVNGSRNSYPAYEGHSALMKSPLEISTIERLGGHRNILGPEFVIRNNETYNIHSHSKRRSSLFSRTDSGRLIRSEVMVKLLNGIVLSVKSLNSKSTINQVINAIHLAYPDLEFVNYGLCFTLDSEFFFLKEDCNVHKLIKYISQKNNHLKSEERLDLNSGLQLFYRLKYYPTMETFREMNSLGQRVLYWQLRQDILERCLPHVSLSDALFLAGAAANTEFGDKTDNLKDQSDYFKLEYYLNKSFIRFLNVEDEDQLLQEHQSQWQSMQWDESQQMFIEKVISNKNYGLHWYKVNKNQLSVIGAIGKDTFIVIGRNGIQLIDVWRTKIDVQMQWHFNYKWKQIDMITLKNKKLMIKPKMQLKIGGVNDGCSFVCYLDSRTKAEYIVRLCTDHHLLASQEDGEDPTPRSICNNTGSHLRLSSIDYPVSLGRSDEVGDDDIFIDHSSSDEDLCQSARTFKGADMNPSQHRLNSMRSLENLNRVYEEQCSLGTDNDKSRHDLDQGLTHQSENDELNQSPFTSLTDGTSGDEINRGDHYSIFEVEIKRVKNESIGIGILNLKTKDLQGIFIKCFTENSVAEKCGKLKVGDEIVSINNDPVSHISQDEVRDVIKNSGNNIRLLLRRHNSVKAFEDVPEINCNEILHLGSSNGNHHPKTPATHGVLKTTSIFQQCLSSSNSLEILRSKYTSIAIPPATIGKDNNYLKSKVKALSDKEVKGFQERLKWNSKNAKDDLTRDNKTFEITVVLNDLLCHKLPIKLDVNFTIVCTQGEDISKDSLWRYASTKESRLVVVLGSKNLTNSLLQNKEVLDKRYEVAVEENCDLSDTLNVRRLKLKGLKSPFYCDDSIYNIQFCEWDNKKTSVDSIVQIVNLACTLNQNIPNEGPIIIVYDDPNNKPANFIVLYILLLLNLHCELSVEPIFRNQTIVHSVYSQIIQQSKWLIPSEVHFRSCISALQMLLPYADGCGSSLEDSDIE